MLAALARYLRKINNMSLTDVAPFKAVYKWMGLGMSMGWDGIRVG